MKVAKIEEHLSKKIKWQNNEHKDNIIMRIFSKKLFIKGAYI